MLTHFEESITVRAHDVDLKNNLKVSSIFNYMQDAASNHASNLGVGFEDIAKLNFFWVLSWMKIKIEKYPKFEDSLKIKTWPKDKFKFYYLRDFTLSDDKRIFAKAASGWIPLKLDSKRPVDLAILNIDFPFQREEHALNEYPGKIKYDISCPEYQYRKIKYSDIDINKHVNNARYIEFIQDCFDENHFNKKELENITISFTSECRLGDEMKIVIDNPDSDGTFSYVEAANLANEKKVFQSLIKWRDI